MKDQYMSIILYAIDDAEQTNNSSLFKPAYAQTEPKITELASADQGFHVNEYTDTPTVRIAKIARDLNGNGKIDEKTETLNSPLGENGFALDALKEHINDSEYLKKNNYFEVYPNQKGNFDSGNPLSSDIEQSYKEKIYPGDKIYYNLEFKNYNDLINPNLMWSIPKAASDWMCKGSTSSNKCDNSYSSTVINNQTVIYKSFPVISAGEPVNPSITYWITLADSKTIKDKTIASWVAAGSVKYKYIYTPGLAKFAEYLKLSNVQVERDVFDPKTGKKITAGSQPTPATTAPAVPTKTAKIVETVKNVINTVKQTVKNILNGLVK